MLRVLRAFAWMRWRVLMNSFERTGSRVVLANGKESLSSGEWESSR